MGDGFEWQSVENVLVRVYPDPVKQHFVVQVGAGASTGTADGGDLIAPFHDIAGLHQDFMGVAKPGHHAVTVVEHQGFAQQAFIAGVGYDAVRRGDNRGSLLIRNIKAFVKFPQAGEWRFAVSKPGCFPAGGRPDGGSRCQQVDLVFQIIYQGAETIRLLFGSCLNLVGFFMHFPDQAIVLFRQGNTGVNVFGYGSTDTKESVPIGGFLDIRNNTDLVFELIKGQQLCFQGIDLPGELLQLLALGGNFLGLVTQR